MVKAVAAAMGRQYNRHEVFRQIIRQVASRTGNRRRLVKLSHSAEMLHSNYYQRKMFLDAGDIADDLNDVAELLDRLTPLISATTRNLKVGLKICLNIPMSAANLGRHYLRGGLSIWFDRFMLSQKSVVGAHC